MKKFRALRADEIECRISTVKENGLSLLLYKDARCDMNILDETVGPENWQRQHSRDNANCTVSIWDEGKGQWISKEDTGTESYTEKEKGLASDSFKRACFNWGIGRELYTAPFIWIPKNGCTISKRGDKFVSYDSFYVTKIGYNDQGSINALQIRNAKMKKVVFDMGNGQTGDIAGTDAGNTSSEATVRVTPPMIATLRKEIDRIGWDEDSLLRWLKTPKIDMLTVQLFKFAMNKMKEKPDAQLPPPSPDEPPAELPEYEGLPFQ